MSGWDILKVIGRLLAHTALAILAACFAGATAELLLKPIMGKQRYAEFAVSNTVLVLVLAAVTVSGALLYLRWQNRQAFLAWLVPALLYFHTMIVGTTFGVVHRRRLEVSLLLFEIGMAYSAGAALCALGWRSRLRSS